MQTAVGVYTKDIRKRFGYHASWLPDNTVGLGDYGLIEGGKFVRHGNVNDMGISFKSRNPDKRSDICFSSASSIAIRPSAAGTAGTGTIEFVVEFKQKNAILFSASGCSTVEVENLNDLGNQVLTEYRRGMWEDDWLVVTEVLSADELTVLISGEAEAQATLTAPGSPEDLSGSLAALMRVATFRAGKELTAQVTTQTRTTPLFQLHHVKPRFVSSAVFRLGMHNLSREGDSALEAKLLADVVFQRYVCDEDPAD